MEGIITNFRSSVHTQKGNHILIMIDGISSREDATNLVGKEVSWKSPAGKEIKGKIASAHGSKGIVRAIFERGLPGQSLATKVVIA